MSFFYLYSEKKNNSFFSVKIIRNLLFSCFLFLPSQAWAVQAHGGLEGLVSHQIGHMLFLGGLLLILRKIHQIHLSQDGWNRFKYFILLMFFWNILTFSGHLLDELIAQDKFVKSMGQTLSFEISTPLDIVYYITRLDHVLLVPSFIMLLLALKRWVSKA